MIVQPFAFTRLQQEFEQWKRDRTKDDRLDDEWIKDVKLDVAKQQQQQKKSSAIVTMRVDLDFTDEFRCVTVIIPDATYPQGTYRTIMEKNEEDDDDNNNEKEFTGSTLVDVLDKVLAGFEERRERLMQAHDDDDEDDDDIPTPATPAFSQDSMFDDDEDHDLQDEEEHVEIYVDGGSAAVLGDEGGSLMGDTFGQIETDMDKVRRTKGWFANIGACGVDQIRLYMYFDPRQRLQVSDLVANAWGIDLDKYIVLSLAFSSYYLESHTMPQIEATQAGNCRRSAGKEQFWKTTETTTKFGLYWTVEQRIREDFFKRYWPIERYTASEQHKTTGRNYMEALLQYAEDTIKTSPGKCLVCSDPLPYEGLKSTVCVKPLCIFSHEQYGLGVDLESVIRNDAETVDLMVSLTYAACNAHNNNYDPFNPFPTGIESKVHDKSTGAVVTHNFLRHDNGKPDSIKVRMVLDILPPVKQLKEWAEVGKLKANCDKLNPMMYPLLRWIMASNRAHLKKLEKHEQIAAMNTSHQYIMMASSPEKEQEFQRLKQQHGSVYAFHGSPLCNWHSIMRTGLKNMSNTSAMLNGAAYGKGIYLAANCNVSFSYMRYAAGWRHSCFSSSQMACLAMCEIIRAPELPRPNPYHVIEKESYVQTRYFFLYTSTTHASVDGNTVRPPPIKWDTPS